MMIETIGKNYYYDNNISKENRMLMVFFALIGIADADILYSLFQIDSYHHPYESVFFEALLVFSIVTILIMFFEILKNIISSPVKPATLYVMGVLLIIVTFKVQIWLLDNGFRIIQRQNLMNQLFGL